MDLNNPIDDAFLKNADAHIELANEHLKTTARGRASAAMMYGSARYNAWVSATGWESGEDMQANRDETIDYFVAHYRKMLEENMDDYIANHAKYIQRKSK